jgi:transcriptional regulator with XRE-family HTH domain
MPVVNRLKEFLTEKGISVYRFRLDLDMSQTTAYKLVNNPKQIPSGEVLGKICDYYSVPVQKIIEWIPPLDNEKASELTEEN